ncbi:NUDIX domain-containing protein, partial [Leptospira wolffii]
GENAEDALKRELKEELSLDVTSSSFLFLNESIDPKGNRHLIQLVFLTTVKKQDPTVNLKEKAITGFGYFPLGAVLEMDIRPDIKEYLSLGKYKPSPFIRSQWVYDK